MIGIYGFLSRAFIYFKQKDKKKEDPKYTQQDCKNLSNTVQPVASGGKNSNIKLEIHGNNNVINNTFYVNHEDAKNIQSEIKKHTEENGKKESDTYIKEAMYWSSASFIKRGKGKNKDKVIIEKIDENPKKAVFLNKEDRKKCSTKHKDYPNKEWQDLIYHVDVETIFVNEKLQEYKITKVHEEVSAYDDL